ncbi:MAG: monovalent cation/H+ antiporter subunit D family protein [Thermodesulfovibrionales bacterium]|nr:monovalent cation/H+ antiporter subunit D family protein [Thermodesulfovibrionales bacterium]
MITHAPILIIVTPLISAFFNILIGLWRRWLCYPFVITVLSACVFSSIAILDTVINYGTIHYKLGGWTPPWGIEYVIDHLNAFMAVIVSFISLIVAVYSKRSIEQELSEKIVYFYTIYLLLVTGLLGIIVTGDVFNLYVFLEIASLAGYALIAIGEDRAPLASFEYVIIGTVGACFYLLGVGYLYIVTGSLNMTDLSQLLPNLYHSKVVLVAFAFLMVGVAVKMAFFPLHVWLPDAYTYAPSTVSALVAATMTKVGAYVMIRIMFTLFKPYFSIELLPVTTVLGWIAVVAMMFGCIFAMAQSDLKRMLCYILIAEVGYIVLGVSFANRMGLTGAILHILNDAFMMACLFSVAGAIMYKIGKRDIKDFRHLHRKMPFTMAAFTIAALSVIGIPPTCGFFSKWYLILGAIDAQQWIFAVALMISSLLSAIVFFRVIENTYFEPRVPVHAHNGGTHEEIKMDEAPLSMLIPIFIMVAGILTLGIFSGKIISNVIQFAVPASF